MLGAAQINVHTKSESNNENIRSSCCPSASPAGTVSWMRLATLTSMCTPKLHEILLTAVVQQLLPQRLTCGHCELDALGDADINVHT
jgi:hypothetical protein